MLHGTLFVCGVFVTDFIFDSMGEFGVASHYLLVLNLLLFMLEYEEYICESLN